MCGEAATLNAMTTPSPEVVQLMRRLGDALGHATQPASLHTELTRAVAAIRSLFSAAACSCALVDDDGETLRFVAADGAGADAIVGVTLPVSRGIAGWTVMSGQSLVVADVREDSRFARDVAEATQYVPETILASPLIGDDGEVAGVLEVLDPQQRGEHSGFDLDVLGLVAAQLATMVRLCAVYDGLGTSLVRALAGAADEDDFGDALSELASTDATATDLAALARTFHQLAVAGPEGARVAGRILEEVAAFIRVSR
jgi:signal transduction protein with GAF and PtsI domain